MNAIRRSVSFSMLLCALALLAAGASAGSEESLLLPEQERALHQIARGQTAEWLEITPEQAERLHAKAEKYLDYYKRYHLPHGLNADVWWTDYDRSQVYRLEGLGDSAAWTGHYLAALALRYHLTRDPETRSDILAVLDKFDLLTVVSGREGYIARYAGPATDAGYQGYYSVYGRGEDPDRPGLGKRAYRGVEPYTDMVWLGYSSRDTYDGVNFGLATTLAYVDDAEIRGRIKSIVERVADRLIPDDWSIPDGKGHTTRATPWYKMAWMRTILTVNPEKYDQLMEEYEESCETLSRSRRVSNKWYREYFANNLRFIRTFALCALEEDPARKKMLADALEWMYGAVADHLNAQFAAIYLAGTGNEDSLGARAVLQGMLVDYPDPPKFFRAIDHRNDPAIEARDDAYTRYALLAREQIPDDFIWQRSPCLRHGKQDLPYELPGIDVFLPYWMGRVAGVIPPPRAETD
jgi:hypothetical protein